LGGQRSFAAFARALANLEEATVHMAVELKNAAFDLMAAMSPICLMLRCARMTSVRKTVQKYVPDLQP
jgi:hypothetical protein